MSVLTEGKYVGDWLKGETQNPTDYSREVITILAGSGSARALTSGMVLAKITKGAATSSAFTGSGGGTITANPTVLAAAKVGVYRATCVLAGATGKFMIQDPDGITIGYATVGTEFSTHLTFTIADGTPDFAVGDYCSITVAAGSGKWVQYDEDGLLGSEDAAGILLLNATAADGADGEGVAIVRDAVVSANGIVWPATADTNEKAAATAQLAALGILVREAA